MKRYNVTLSGEQLKNATIGGSETPSRLSPKFECTQLRVFWQYAGNLSLLKLSFIGYATEWECEHDVNVRKMIFMYVLSPGFHPLSICAVTFQTINLILQYRKTSINKSQCKYKYVCAYEKKRESVLSNVKQRLSSTNKECFSNMIFVNKIIISFHLHTGWYQYWSFPQNKNYSFEEVKNKVFSFSVWHICHIRII